MKMDKKITPIKKASYEHDILIYFVSYIMAAVTWLIIAFLLA